MKEFRDLKKRGLEFKRVLDEKERFIRKFGSVNCKYLTFKPADEVLKELLKANPDPIDLEAKKFIMKNSGKEVLCNVLEPYGNTDIFVFGDDNIPFNTECFVSE